MIDHFNEDEVNLFKRVIKTICISFAVVFIIASIFLCFYNVDEQHAVVVTNFGRIQRVDEFPNANEFISAEDSDLIDADLISGKLSIYDKKE